MTGFDDLEFDQVLLGCRPVEMDAVMAEYLAKTGQDLSDPYPGSVQGACEDCQRAVWIGPRQQEAQRKMMCKVLCLTCAALEGSQPQHRTSVHSLGNVHPRE